LILSFIFRQTHNSFIKINSKYTNTEDVNDAWYGVGAVIGVLATGVMADLVTKNKQFLTIFILNIVLFLWDIYLFFNVRTEEARAWSRIFSICLGAILASADLIYVILIPMLIAKQHSQKMAMLNNSHRMCYAGSIVGVVLALCEVG
jgi:sugar phosphate permease